MLKRARAEGEPELVEEEFRDETQPGKSEDQERERQKGQIIGGRQEMGRERKKLEKRGRNGKKKRSRTGGGSGKADEATR
jgi:hypothetical protein